MRWIPALLLCLALPGCILVSKTETTSPKPSKVEAGLRAELKAARERNDELQATLAAYRKLYGLLPAKAPEPFRVAAVNRDLNLVVVTLPPDHGVEAGQKLRLPDGATFTIESVGERTASGVMEPGGGSRDVKVADPVELVLPPVEEKPPEPRDTSRSGKTEDVPKIDSKVAAVNPESNVVVISGGRDVGVEPGYEFTVFRGNEYVARIVIDKVEEDFSSGYSMKEIEKSPIRVGDDVTTKF
jgi:hypothetical protein